MLRPLLFVVPVVLAGLLIGWLNIPGAWYESLAKPGFNPPNQVFGPVWTVLYVLIGIVGWRVFDRIQDQPLRWLWALQLGLNFAWSPAFFGLQNIALGLVIILALLATLVAFCLRARTREPVSALLFLPYIAWVAFASLLNIAIWRLN
ncbi:tryptophan-rich sensory protein [Pseudomonas sp. GX19020]|uniref:TspO/MBR family protein n=1 Tax=Pseudomonas sp. GX19020 TaxID=2942277 RepID=UPI00201859DA|nr:TspO/MBR family protein [Pseudomonas sp. GX19020]MCL4067483.1 tryptophan-rich sensory protein [Pseudomonas sp. GX19020]